jgi:hypothetical protein
MPSELSRSANFRRLYGGTGSYTKVVGVLNEDGSNLRDDGMRRFPEGLQNADGDQL